MSGWWWCVVEFEVVSKGFKGGHLDSFSLVGCKVDCKWLNVPSASSDGSRCT